MTLITTNNNLTHLKEIIQQSPVAHKALKNCLNEGCYLAHNSRGWTDTVVVVPNHTNRRPTNTPVYVHDYYDTVLDAVTGISYRSNALFGYAYEGLHLIPNNKYLVLPKKPWRMMAVEGVNDFYVTLNEVLIPSASKVTIETLCDLYHKQGGFRMIPMERFVRELMPLFINLYKEPNLPSLLEQAPMVELLGFSPMVATDIRLIKTINRRDFKRTVLNSLYTAIDRLSTNINCGLCFGSLVETAKRRDEVHLHSDEYILINMGSLRKERDKLCLDTVESVLEKLL